MSMNDEEWVLSSFTNGFQLRSLLVATKGESSFQSNHLPESVQDVTFLSSLESAQLLKKDGNRLNFPGYAKIRVAIRALQLGEPNRPVLTALTWQEFEEFVAHVLTFHDFTVLQRFRFSTNRRFEIDIVAHRQSVLLCIDCKQYGVRLGKASSLRTAAEEQLHRTQVLADNFARFQADLGCLDTEHPVLIPLMVTMMSEDILFHDRVPIIPAPLFNAFLLEYDRQRDSLRVVQPSSSRQTRLI